MKNVLLFLGVVLPIVFVLAVFAFVAFNDPHVQAKILEYREVDKK